MIKKEKIMITNKQLLNKEKFLKAMISMPSITLSPQEADRFLDYIIDQSVLKNNARIEKMSAQSKNIRAMGLGQTRFLKPAATFSTSDYQKTLTENLITLTSKKVRGCVVIYDDDLEDNVEGDAFADHVNRMIAAQIANELEEAFWIGDTHGLSGFPNTDIRSLWDGWRYRLDHSQDTEPYKNAVTGSCTILDASNVITGHTSDFNIAGRIAMVDNTAPYNWEFKFSKMIEVLPAQYKKNGLQNLRFFCPDIVVSNYIEALAARATVLGDNAIIGGGQAQFGMIPIVSVPMMPTTMAADTTDVTKEKLTADGPYSDVVLTHKDNFIIGLHREIKMETQREAADEATYFYYSMRADVAMENVNAAVLLKRLVTTGEMLKSA